MTAPVNVEDEMSVQLDTLLDNVTREQLANGLLYYTPHTKQSWFHAIGYVTFRYLRTGNRFGKSDCGAAEDVAFALGERPWLPKDDPARYAGIPKHSTKGVILVVSWDKAQEIYTNQEPGVGIGKLFRFIPVDRLVSVHKNHSGKICRIVIKSIHGGNSQIYINTVEAFLHNPKIAESSSWDFIHIDEPIPEKMWTGYARGLMDRRGKAWFTCTPVSEPWINNFFGTDGRSSDGRMLTFDKDAVNMVFGTKAVIIGTTYDNPYISREGVEEYESTLDEADREARINGYPLERTGRIYPTLTEERHAFYDVPDKSWVSLRQPPKEWTCAYAIDPHPKTPHAVLFVAISPENHYYFYEEIFDPCVAKALAGKILNVTDGYFVSRAIADPSAWIEEPSTKKTFAHTLLEFGLHPLERGIKDPGRGIIETKQALAEGRIHIGFHLTNLWNELHGYVWNPNGNNKPVDKNDHLIECLHRIVMANPQFIQLDAINVEAFQYQ